MTPIHRRSLSHRRRVAGDHVTFLIRDDFSSNLAAGSVHGTPAEPGPGTRDVNDAGNHLDLNGGYLRAAGRANVCDPGIRYTPTLARATGRAVFLQTVTPTDGDWHGGWGLGFGWLGYCNPAWTPTKLNIYTSAQYVGTSETGEIWAANVLRASGQLVFIKESAGWVLAWVDSFLTIDPCYVVSGAFGSGQASAQPLLKSIRAADLGAPFHEEFGLATHRLAGSRSPGDTFIHEADAFLEFTVATLPAAGQIELRFRIQDASNYWQVTVDSAGNLDLDEVVAAVPTQRGTSAACIANGDFIIVRFVGSDIRVYEGANHAKVRRISYAFANNFQTQTGGELETEGTGGAVSDIVSWPRTLTSAQQAELNRYVQ